MKRALAPIPRGLPDHRNREHKNYLYAFEFADGTVKIGVTWNPQQRAGSVYTKHKRAIVRAYVAPVVDGYRTTAERAALASARKIAMLMPGETEIFVGLRFHEATHAIRQSAARLYDRRTGKALRRPHAELAKQAAA